MNSAPSRISGRFREIRRYLRPLLFSEKQTGTQITTDFAETAADKDKPFGRFFKLPTVPPSPRYTPIPAPASPAPARPAAEAAGRCRDPFRDAR